MRGLSLTVFAFGAFCLAPGARAQEADEGAGPDLDFLEYLGAWQAEDDEWLVIEEWHKDNGAAEDGRGKDDGEGEKPERQRNEND